MKSLDETQTSQQRPQPNWKRASRLAIGLLLGAALGYGYYALVGCSSGACVISSSPTVSSAYGAIIGGFVTAGL